MAQPRVGAIEVFGNGKTSRERVLKVLKVREGDVLGVARAEFEERVRALDGVVGVSVEAFCCSEKKVVLYVGIEERGGARLDYRVPEVTGDRLPEEVLGGYGAFLDALEAGEDLDENLSLGFSLVKDPKARAAQAAFPELAEKYEKELRRVLRGGEAEERAVAAYVLGYAGRKQEVVDDLQAAMRDADAAVRRNAMRALTAAAVYAGKDPALGVQVQPTWLVATLGSAVWSDRLEAARSLVDWTGESRRPELLQRIEEGAMAALTESAMWATREHALPFFVLWGRVLGLTEGEMEAGWAAESRGAWMKETVKRLKRNKKA
jgi:hypothetical protein